MKQQQEKQEITKKILIERQSWTLEQKIDHAVGTIENFIAQSGRTPYVSFSGGKDSTVLLDICRRFVRPNMKAVFNNTGNEYPEIVQFVHSVENVTIITPKINIREVIAKQGFPLVSKEIAKKIQEAKTTKSKNLLNSLLYGKKNKNGTLSGKISEKWKFLIQEPFRTSSKCCNILKKHPFKKYNRETNEIPIIGTMAQESRLRETQYIIRGGCNSFNENNLASYPLSIWTESDIWAYIRKFNIKICKLYNNPGCKRTGCMFCGFGAHLEKHSRFELLYDLHPNIYKAIMKYENNGITYRQALQKIGIILPDEIRQLEFDFK